MIDANAELVPLEPSASNLPSTERTPTQQKLAQEIIKKLSSTDAIQIRYDPAKGRAGQERFVVVDSEDSKAHIVLQAHAQGGDVNPIGLEYHDLVRGVWLDESTMILGGVDFVDRVDSLSYTSRSGTILDLKSLEYFRDQGGIDFLAVGNSPASEQEIEDVTTKLEHGHVNTELTQAALKHLETTWGARRIEPPAQIPPATV
jgi:hypothetical protein